jgi:hypothetical protein
VAPVALKLICSWLISLAVVSKAATMLAKLCLNPVLSLLMPGTGKLMFMPDTLTLMLLAIARHCCVDYLSSLCHHVVT